MKNAGIVLGFLPLIIYGVLAGSGGLILALAAATTASIIFCYNDLRNRMILSWTNLVLFGFLLLATLAGLTWISQLSGILIYASLAAVTFGSILTKSPFTIQYARRMVDPAMWENPYFIRVNVLMTGVWGAIFFVNLILSGIALTAQGLLSLAAQLLIYGALGAGIAFTLLYPRHIRKKKAPNIRLSN
jgi:hypothetical protein